MQIRLLLGPAGSGKTFRCLAEIRQALIGSPEGPPLILVAPKQTTYQLERELLSDAAIQGYTRLHILSFERLAYKVFEMLNRPGPELLGEEGRLMVLRGLLARKKNQLKLFRASARLAGFARQLSQVLHEFQRNRLTPETLKEQAAKLTESAGLAGKLEDLATLYRHYLDWLNKHKLQDADCLLDAASASLSASASSSASASLALPNPAVAREGASSLIEDLWVDGFSEFSEQQLELLATLLPHCGHATLTLCLDRIPTEKLSWISTWALPRRTFEHCKRRFEELPLAQVSTELLPRRPQNGRFAAGTMLARLEESWGEHQPATISASPGKRRKRRLTSEADDVPLFAWAAASISDDSLRIVSCEHPEAEADFAARTILRFVRQGGRYRDIAVLVRKLEGYYQPLERIFTKYEIPFFLDRRESVSQHPLAELARNTMRTVALGWQHEDWFAVLKTGLAPADDHAIDELENEALARGWSGKAWYQPLRVSTAGTSEERRKNLELLQARLEETRLKVVPPFERFALAMAAANNQPAGPQLAAAMRDLWSSLDVEGRLRKWAVGEDAGLDPRIPSSVHATVLEQMNSWLESVELAFPDEPVPLRHWLPIIEAGLSNLSVGVIPPALDQVLIGAIDRSRDPDIKLALVLGLNEGVFPALPESGVLLTDAEREELSSQNIVLGVDTRRQLGRERFYAYLAFTRPRRQLILSSSFQDGEGTVLNPSPFLAQVKRLFPHLEVETIPREVDWREAEHPSELIPLILSSTSSFSSSSPTPLPGLGEPEAEEEKEEDVRPQSPWQTLSHLPSIAALLDRLRQFDYASASGLKTQSDARMEPHLADQLYGPALRTSVSRMEQFAACPFKFFVHSGLRAEERQRFELDIREQGTFQHDVLALFHDQLRRENKRWRDITPGQARERIGRIAAGLIAGYREGLLQASEQARFVARSLTESLQDFIETAVGWMGKQYQFEPEQVELPFGSDPRAPAWLIDLGDARQLELNGRIDRVDLWRRPGAEEALCVVVDYKSSLKKLDPLLVANGLQLQLLAYLNVVRRWPNPGKVFGSDALIPAGVFYVNLRGNYDRKSNRREALADPAHEKMLAYRHSGCFDESVLRLLDGRPDARDGTQFRYVLNDDGSHRKRQSDGLETPEFLSILESTERSLKTMGARIYQGEAGVDPYRRGAVTACDQCSYRAICRIDPWTHNYRVLREP